MDIKIEDIKSLDPGKVYLVYLDFKNNLDKLEVIEEYIRILQETAREVGITFLFLDKNIMEVKSPTEIEITTSSGN